MTEIYLHIVARMVVEKRRLYLLGRALLFLHIRHTILSLLHLLRGISGCLLCDLFGGIHCSDEQARQLSDAIALQTTLMEQVRHLSNAGSIHCSECLGFCGFPLHEFRKCAYCNAIVCLRCTYTTGILCPALPSECPHRYVRIEEQASSQSVHPMQTASQSSSSDRPHHNEQQQWSAIYRIDTLARWEHLVRTRRLLDAHRNMRP